MSLSGKALQEEYGAWLERFAWDFFATLTYRDEPKMPTAQRRFHAWTRVLERRGLGSVSWFAVFEYGGAEQLHAHALLGGGAMLSAFDLRDAWRHGLSHAVRYNPKKGAARYIAKAVADPRAEYDISQTLPPRRPGGRA